MTEMSLLAGFGLFVVALHVLCALSGAWHRGLRRSLRGHAGRRYPAGMPGRLARGRDDCLIGLVLLTPAVSILVLRDIDNGMTLLAMQLYVMALAGRAVIRTAGVPCVDAALGAVGLPPVVYLYYVAVQAPAAI